METGHKTIVWFEEVTKKDIPIVGGKGANLGEMTHAGIPVPPGFIVTANAYFDYLKEAGLTEKIRALLKPLDVHKSRQLQEIAVEVQKLITDSPMTKKLAGEIKEAYRKMGKGLVAVRSSATAEDLPEASFAGQQATFLNIEGEDAVVDAVQECWASLFGARAIFYRQENGFEHFKVGIAVPVQRMVQSLAAGVMFTVEPTSSDKSLIVVESVLGLGEMIVSGDVTPDHYAIRKSDLKVLKKEVKRQEWKLVRNPKGTGEDRNIKINLTDKEKSQQKITDEDIITLAKLGKKLEEHYQFPQDIEWAKEDGKIYIVQTRPVTTIKTTDQQATPEINAPVLLSGAPASPGIAAGPVKIVPDPSQIDKVLTGDILVAEMTTPDFVPAMKRAAAIVTDRGGRTAHAAIVSRELGIPCVVGTEKATKALKDGQMITVDGSKGKVYAGKIEVKVEKATRARGEIKTRTKLLVNLAQPELVDRVAQRDVDGIGLLRAEFMVAQIGEHPSYMLEHGRGQEFVDKLSAGLSEFARAFNPRQVVYRTNDSRPTNTAPSKAVKNTKKWKRTP
ncbi:MAG: phosphoenolpyruvate synthase [Dehalococcoidales bacterium]|nr:phosphoenolpyruvate synthase [Dehalococcoidales bacterium]